ncbi:MAG: hypothetical protein WCO07_01745 [bacterium]
MKKDKYKKNILKILAEKPAVTVVELRKKITTPSPLLHKEERENFYAINRSLKNLVEAGCVEIHNSDNQKYLKITKRGTQKLNYIRLEGANALVSNTWDGFWRIIIFDIPENRKSEREALRYLLKKANFTCVKNTVWISPYPFEHLFTNIKKDLKLGNELMIIVTDKLDPETNVAFLKSIKK